LREEFAVLGENQLLFSYDYPHGEGWENPAQEFLARGDISKGQKQKSSCDNPIRLFGEV